MYMSVYTYTCVTVVENLSPKYYIKNFQNISVRGAQGFLMVSNDTSITFVPSFVKIGEMVKISEEACTQISTVISYARLFPFKEEEKYAKIGLVSFVYTYSMVQSPS